MKFPLKKLPGWLVKFAKAILKAHEAGLLEQANQPAFGDRTTDTPPMPEAVRDSFLRGSRFLGGPDAAPRTDPHEQSRKLTREKLGEGFLVAAGCVLIAAGIACATLQQTADRLDCRVLGCSKGYACQQTNRPESREHYECVAEPTPAPTASPTAAPSLPPPPTPIPPTPAPTASPTAAPTAPPPTPTPTATPCAPVVQQVCVDGEGNFIGVFDPKATSGPSACWRTKDWVGYMKNHYWKAADGTLRVVNGVELGVNLGGSAGNRSDECTRTDDGWRVDCADPSRRIAWAVDLPRMVERTVPCASPSTPPTPGPSAPPTPQPSNAPGCPPLLRVGGMMLAARDCGQKCRDDGYLGYIVNYTATELCEEGVPGCVCDPARNCCERPHACQNPNGATVYIKLPGVFGSAVDGYDICDERSDNPFNCHHKPKANETGVTEFRSCPRDARPSDARCVSKFIDVRPGGPVALER